MTARDPDWWNLALYASYLVFSILAVWCGLSAVGGMCR
jgi:hypothetical protein